MKYFIYLYTSPSKKHYVGITDNLERRMSEHKKKEEDLTDTTKFANAIKKYSFVMLGYQVLETVDSVEEAKAKEIEYIKFYDSYINGYNCTPGGDYCGSPKKLSQRDVEDIRYMLSFRQDLKMQDIADIFNVEISCISQIKNDKLRSAYNNHGKIKRVSHCRKGEEQTNSKLTDEQVIEIRKELTNGVTRKDIQKKYTISKTLVQMIATREAWNHLEDGYVYEKKELNGNAKLTPGIVGKIKYHILQEVTDGKIAGMFGISRATVMQIRKRKTWKDTKVIED